MRLAVLFTLCLLLGSAARAETVRFSDHQENIVFTARGQDIEISGDHGNILISGSAHRVTVAGHHHNVVLEDAAEIVLDGHHIDLTIARVGAIILNGHHNDLVVTDCQPAVTDRGDYNDVVSGMGTVPSDGPGDGVSVDPGNVHSGAGAPLTLSGTGRTETLNVDGQDVVVEGSDNRFTLLGRPTSVTVIGALNHVDIEETGAIVIEGALNVVTYKLGSPRIEKTGIDNKVNGL